MKRRMKSRRTNRIRPLVALVPLAMMVVAPGHAMAADYSTSQYWANATRTHNFVNASTTASPAGLWKQSAFNNDGAFVYTATNSTIYAWSEEANLDAVIQMLRTTGSASGAGAPYLARMKAVHTSFNHLWDYGYVNGGWRNGPGSPHKYADENCIAGVTFADAYDTLVEAGGTQADKDRVLNAAKATATYMLGTSGHPSQLWNYTPTAQGKVGGYWWATTYHDANANPATNTRAATDGVRATEVNANCAHLFADLYRLTGNSTYLTAARTVMGWMNANLRDPVSGLYYWGIWDKKDTTSAYTHHSVGLDKNKFAYDQSFMIEANVAMAKATTSGTGSVSGSYRTDAQNLADALVNTGNGLWTTNTITTNGTTYHPGFIQSKGWTSGPGNDPANHTFADNKSISSIFTGWVSEALIELYNYEQTQASPDPGAGTWLSVAKSNVDTLNSLIQTAPAGGKYYYTAGPGTGGTYVIKDANITATAQPYMEKLNALLAPLFQ